MLHRHGKNPRQGLKERLPISLSACNARAELRGWTDLAGFPPELGVTASWLLAALYTNAGEPWG